ncbi:MAG: hypothetical protein O3B95_08380 [Chloroflexi bacterium]|nr:hypothetical protein [Chloroflexota bacterium]
MDIERNTDIWFRRRVREITDILGQGKQRKSVASTFTLYGTRF